MGRCAYSVKICLKLASFSDLEIRSDDRITHLESTRESIQQNRKEQEGSPAVETGSVIAQVIEDTADDESHNRITDQLSERQRRIPPQTLKTTNDTQVDLLHHRQRVRRLDSSVAIISLDSIKQARKKKLTDVLLAVLGGTR